MDDIQASLSKALSNQGWIFGDKLHRIGNPFIWVDGDNTPGLYSVSGSKAILQFLSMFYEEYPMIESVITNDYEKVRSRIRDYLLSAFRHFTPFLDTTISGFDKYIDCTALIRAQDYSIIRSLCHDLKSPINHLDIGPGLGSHAIYSLMEFESCYYAIEASPHSYSAQRNFFRFLSHKYGFYLDVVECESYDLSQSLISELVNENMTYRIKHIPSWHFDIVKDQSIDLITATWVLNEVSLAGILWLMSHAMRVLRNKGYFYIRDSSRLKPLRHSIDYDELLTKMGFKEVERIQVRNRVDFYGVPRVYQKENKSTHSFDNLVGLYLGKHDISAKGSSFAPK